MIIEDYRRLPDLIVFSIFNVLLLSPLEVYALLILDKTGWGTRWWDVPYYSNQVDLGTIEDLLHEDNLEKSN